MKPDGSFLGEAVDNQKQTIGRSFHKRARDFIVDCRLSIEFIAD